MGDPRKALRARVSRTAAAMSTGGEWGFPATGPLG